MTSAGTMGEELHAAILWEEALRGLRERLSDQLLLAFSILGAPALVIMFSRIFIEGWRDPLTAMAIATYLILLCTTLARRRLGLAVKSAIIIGLFFAFGVANSLNFGLLSGGRYILGFASIVTAFLLGMRPAIIVLAASVSFIWLHWAALQAGWLTLDVDADAYLRVSWRGVVRGLGVVLTTGPVLVGLSQLVTALATTFRAQQDELHGRLHTQERLQEALTRLLSGYVTICAACKKIEGQSERWTPVEQYIEQRTEVQFTHGLCPICLDKASAELDD